MSNKSNATLAKVVIAIGKYSLNVIGLDRATHRNDATPDRHEGSPRITRLDIAGGEEA
jgi:hypothetical protein